MRYNIRMSQLLGDILNGRSYSEPPEIRQIKAYVHKAINIMPEVSITTAGFVVQVPSAAAAGALRGHVYQLQKELETKKRIIIRIR